MPGVRQQKSFVGRVDELRALEEFLGDVRRGESHALVLSGEPGVGKSALLDHLTARAEEFRVVGAVGVEAEMEVSFAALHQLCAPLLDHLQALPAPQRDAMEITFGMSAGVAPERLLVGLAVLGLLAEAATERPVLAVFDDAQWLDSASAQIVSFVTRRLGAESVGMVIATRTLTAEWSGLPGLAITGLADDAARLLLDSVLRVPVDQRVRDQFVAETHGNPLAVLELSRGLGGPQLAGGFALPRGGALSGRIEESFRRRVEEFPTDTQRLLLLAAADPLGDPLLLWRGAELLGIDAAAVRPAIDDALVSVGSRIRFSHPLVRSAVYRSASMQARREVHAALASATDADVDPERRAWHRAESAAGPDEDVAAELERYAGRAQARGGWAAAAAFLERATVLSPHRSTRAARALAAAQAKVQSGAFPEALDLMAVAEAGPLTDFDRAKLDLVRAQMAFATNRGSQAPPLLLAAAKRLEPIDLGLARATYMDALMAAHLAGSSAGPEADVYAVARALRAAPAAPQQSGATDLLLDGLSATYLEGYAVGLPLVRDAVMADRTDIPADQELRWLLLATRAAMHIWDDERALAHSSRFVELSRAAGALTELTLAINDNAILLLISGDTTAAASAVEEAYAAAEALGGAMVPWGPMGAAAWRGEEAEAAGLIRACRESAISRGEGGALAGAAWAEAVLNNGLGRYQEAAAAAQESLAEINDGVFGLACWVLPELVDAAVHSSAHETALSAQRQLAEMASASRTDWVLGIETVARALVTEEEDEGAEKLFRESIERLHATHLRAFSARAHLLYGEWLRRHHRRVDARSELHGALEMLDAIGLHGFADRARRELTATGETARKRNVGTRTDLTAQEAQVAKLAREGMSNPEIAARLYISARTVQYHLSKVFAKLGITSRSQLERVLE